MKDKSFIFTKYSLLLLLFVIFMFSPFGMGTCEGIFPGIYSCDGMLGVIFEKLLFITLLVPFQIIYLLLIALIILFSVLGILYSLKSIRSVSLRQNSTAKLSLTISFLIMLGLIIFAVLL